VAAVKKSISLPDSLYKLAQETAASEHFPTFSDYLQHVIKEDLARRRTAGAILREQPNIKYPQRKRGIAKEKEN
jgi:Arc/MetJ-type ribon-helix-helix transcriptional regulator